MRSSPAWRHTTCLAFVCLDLIAALAGCGGDEITVTPQKIAVGASPNGIAVRAADGAVFITPDLMAVDAGGKLYTQCNATGLCRIAPDDTISVLANDFQDARGVAVDAPRGRLYAIDRAASASATSYVRSFPLN